jgi:uncharacterized membrane protein (GlpM family)
MTQILIRFFIGGAVVTLFAVLGDLFKPKSFAGLFGAAPSVALATLSLTIVTEGAQYASIEARSMIAGAIAFLVYATCCSWSLMRLPYRALLVAVCAMPLWFATAFGIFGLLLK